MKLYSLKSADGLSKYDYLWRLSSDRWAWEYLRRNPAFRREAETRGPDDISTRLAPCAPIRLLRSRVTQTLAERWGLVFMPDPGLNAVDADAVWTLAAYPDQVEIHCAPRAENETCDIWQRSTPFCRITHVTDRVGREFILVRGRGCVAQAHCTGLSLLGLEPVRMKLTISDMDAYEKRLRIQRAALEVMGDGPDMAPPVWSKRTQMLRDGLIALDALDYGLSRRQIAILLFGEETVAAEWTSSAMKDHMRYLVLKALALRDGGYQRELLGSRTARAFAAS